MLILWLAKFDPLTLLRNFAFVVLVGMLCSLGFDAYGQLNRKAIKKNNRRIGSFRGKKSHFGKEKTYNALGFSLSAFNYYGDLAPKPSRFSTDISFTRPAIGFSFAHRFGPRYTFQAAFTYGTLRGSDRESADRGDASNGRFRSDRNLEFRNRIKELSFVAKFDLFENMATYISRVKWTPYAFLGFSVFHHNPQALAPEFQIDGITPIAEAGQWVDLQPLGTEGQYASLRDTDINKGIKPYKLIQPAIPVGAGMRFRLNEVMDFSAEINVRYLFTDYVDDVSQNYIDLGLFGDNELAKAMSYRSNELLENQPLLEPVTSPVDGRTYMLLPGYGQEYPDNMRGNRDDRDIFIGTTFRITYIIGKTFHRAKFR